MINRNAKYSVFTVSIFFSNLHIFSRQKDYSVTCIQSTVARKNKIAKKIFNVIKFNRIELLQPWNWFFCTTRHAMNENVSVLLQEMEWRLLFTSQRLYQGAFYTFIVIFLYITKNSTVWVLLRVWEINTSSNILTASSFIQKPHFRHV